MAIRRPLALVSGDLRELPSGDTIPAATLGAHAASHATGGADLLLPGDIGAIPKLVPTATKTSAYTAVSGELVMCDDTAGAFTVTLPAATVGSLLAVKKIVSSGNSITISRAGTDTIGGAAATTVAIRLIDETTWLQCSSAGVWMPIMNWVGVPSTDSRYVRTSVAQTWTAKQTFSIAMVSTPVTLTDAATVAIDAALGNHFRLLTTSAVGATRALGAPTNPSDGQKILIEIVQDATGSRLTTYNAVFNFGTDVVSPTLSTAANKRDYLGFVYNLGATKWDALGVSRGY